MQKTHAKAIKGMAIACIAVSAVLIACYIIGAVSMGVLTSVADSYYPSDFGHGFHHGAGYDFYSDYYDYGDSYDAMMVMFGFVVGLCIFGAISAAASLVASIVVFRNWDKPQNYGKVFGWSIAGAILGFVFSGVVLTVLFIIIAVFANGDKKLYQAGMYPLGGQVPTVQATYGTQPVTYAQPQAPAQPRQVAQQAQPVIPEQQPQVPVASEQAQPASTEQRTPLVAQAQMSDVQPQASDQAPRPDVAEQEKPAQQDEPQAPQVVNPSEVIVSAQPIQPDSASTVDASADEKTADQMIDQLIISEGVEVVSDPQASAVVVIEDGGLVVPLEPDSSSDDGVSADDQSK